MDVNETLEQIRQIIRERDDVIDGDSGDAEFEAYHELVDLVQALDEWLSRGGFAPDDWRYLAGQRPE